MRKIVIAVLVALIIGGPVATASPTQFIDRMGPIAQEIVPGYGLWPSVFLAQAALESGWGTSLLSQQANNYFGRKCLELPCIEIKTPEYRFSTCGKTADSNRGSPLSPWDKLETCAVPSF